MILFSSCIRWHVLPCVLVALLAGAAGAQSPEPTDWQDLRPLFRKHCTVCHSAKNVKELDVSGGLALDSYEAVRKGSKRATLEPGKADASLILQLLTTSDKTKRMPLDAPPLANTTVDPANIVTAIKLLQDDARVAAADKIRKRLGL